MVTGTRDGHKTILKMKKSLPHVDEVENGKTDGDRPGRLTVTGKTDGEKRRARFSTFLA